MKQLAIALALFMTACTHVEPLPDATESTIVSTVTGADPGYSACRTAAQLCNLQTQQCCWNPSYNIGGCFAHGSTACTRNVTRVDGPEDCAPGQYACIKGIMTLFGEVYTGACQSAPCNPDGLEPFYNVTLCHNNAHCSNGQTCVRAGALVPYDPAQPWTQWEKNHSGLAAYLWLCK